MLYDTFKTVCKQNGTNLTATLKAIGRSTGLTGKWRAGSDPSLQIVMEMAQYLGISLDEMCYGKKYEPEIPEEQKEWLDIISQIPKEKHEMLKDFLRTHMAVPAKYQDKKQA